MAIEQSGQYYFSPEAEGFKIQEQPLSEHSQSYLTDNWGKKIDAKPKNVLILLANKIRHNPIPEPFYVSDNPWTNADDLESYSKKYHGTVNLLQREHFEALRQNGILAIIAKETKTDIALWHNHIDSDEIPRDERVVVNPFAWDVDILLPQGHDFTVGNRCSDAGPVDGSTFYDPFLSIEVRRGKQGSEELTQISYDGTLLKIRGEHMTRISIDREDTTTLFRTALRDALQNPAFAQIEAMDQEERSVYVAA